MKVKKIVLFILIFLGLLAFSTFTNNVEAESLGYLTTIRERTEGNVKYSHQIGGANPSTSKNIWKLVTCNQQGTPTNQEKDLYCLRAGLGFTSTSLDNKVVSYTESYKMMEQYDSLVNYFGNGISTEITIFKRDNEEKFKAVMWILDNMLLEGATEKQVEDYLKEYAGYTDRTLTQTEFKENVLTRADIEAIQQLAIWYFTNDDEPAYKNETLPPIYMKIAGDSEYETRGEYQTYQTIYNVGGFNGTLRFNAASNLYSKLLEEAKKAAKTDYKPTKDITIYLAGTGAANEQPVVQVKESKKEVDVALRKFITAVNGTEIPKENSREPEVDSSKLNTQVSDKKQTTAEYNHTKVPVKVSVGDTVTYTLRLYNEGEVDTYIKEVTDYLPPYLEYVQYGRDTGNWWKVDGETNRIATSLENCIVIGVGGGIDNSKVNSKLGDVLIPAAKYNAETGNYTLSYVDIQISCKVKTNAPYDTNITNIAQITKMTDANGKNLEKDRDSTPNGGFNRPDDNSLPSYKDTDKDKKYIPGQEDDDDFEKVLVERQITSVTVTKIWNDKENQDNLRGEYKVTLTGKVGEKVVYTDEQTLSATKTTYTWENLDKLSEGQEITYTVTESKVPTGYKEEITGNQKEGFKITNTHTPAEIEVTVNKTWEDNDNQDGKRAEYEVTIVGTARGEEVYRDTQKLNPETLTYKWTKLAKYSKGEEITYTVTESKVPEKYTQEVTGNQKNGFKITNRHTPEKTNVTVTKNWEDNDNQDGLRNKYKVTIVGTAHGKEVYRDERELDPETLTYTWTNLEKYNEGEEITYTVTESKVPEGYKEEVTGSAKEGFEITNTHTPAEIEVTVTKTWEDNDNQDGKRAEYEVTIVGTAHGEEVYRDTQKLNPETLTYTWTKLAKYSKGEEITYTVTESKVPEGYIEEVTGNQKDGIEITNTHTPEKINVSVTKEWIDENNFDELRAEYEVTIIGRAKGSIVYRNVKKLTPEKLSYTWENLDKYFQGEEIEYTVTESLIPLGYTQEVTGNQKDGFKITNTHQVLHPDLSLRKYITEVDGKEVETSREPDVDTGIMDSKEDTTSEYNHPKNPIMVKKGSLVKYTIRVYNEGNINAYASEITDYLPKYLNYLPENEINKKYGWEYDEETREVRTTITAKENTAGDEIYRERENGKLLLAYDGNGELNYIDVKIACEVDKQAEGNGILTNLAQITEVKDEKGKVRDDDRDSKPDDNFELPDDKERPNYKDEESKKDYVPGQEDDDDFEKVQVIPEIDLSLRKYITEVDGKAVETSREPKVDTSIMDRKEDTTSEYNHPKNPIMVKRESLVTYTIRVYNEGEADAFASEVTDYLPKYLNFLPDNEINKKYGWEYDEKTREVKTTITAKENTAGDEVYKERENGKLLLAYDGNGELNYIDVEIVCEIDEKAEGNGILTNLAQITEEEDEEGKKVEEDRDSKPDDNFELPDDEERPNYKDEESDKDYVPGQEDDDDFEKVQVIPEIDLSLRKYITEVDGEAVETSREPKVDTSIMDRKEDTTSEYNHPKNPIMVKRESLVTYTIRVYNEGEADAFASEVTDYLPKYLNFLPDNEINKKYGWEYDEKTREVKTTITAKENTAGDEVYKERENGKLLLAYDGNGELNYIDVEIVCEIDEKAEGNGILTNLAQITEEEDEEGKKVEEDRDSKPDDNFELPDDEDRPNYKDEDLDKDYVPGQEDDDDFEKVQIKPDFDLALRKFITKVENTNVNNRYPEVEYKDGKLSYKHTKTPVELTTGDTVIYTIRVYNEGEADGYANEITDDVPEGLEFLPENETNKEYRWKMLDENEEETTDVSKAKYIITDYLSEEQEKEAQRDNKIKAFNKEGEITDKNPDYRDVKIAFKVTYEAKTKDEEARTIVNTAQISKDSDDDIDSKPNRDEVYNHDNDKDNEDDIDYDQVKVKYFDLSLLKWVTKTMVTLNGKTQEIKSGHTAETSRNEDPVKLEVKSKDVNKIKVKYAYTIRVTNEGEIAGYATEVTDYIPEGLKFVKEDNSDWYELGEGKIGTKKLENKLLKPGESAEVEVILTWINGKENFGEKVNIAEISENKNDEGVPDVDSTPDNQKAGEDDIDDAPSIITVKTGVEQIYVGLILIILITFAGGIGLIKKYVLM